MKEKIINILYYFLPGAAVIILILFVIAFVSSLGPASSLQWNVSNEGFKSLFNIYSSSIQLGAAFLGVMALTLALERLRQTKDQIEVMSDNNKFNNFHKHQKLFYDHMSKTNVIKRVIHYSDWKPNHFISLYYNVYFYKKHENFRSKINDIGFKEIRTFNSELKSSRFNISILSEKEGLNLSDFWEDKIKDIPAGFLGNAINYIFRLYPDWQKEKDGEGELEKVVMTNILSIYYTYFIFQEILIFGGEDIKFFSFPLFIKNVKTICKQRNLGQLPVD